MIYFNLIFFFILKIDFLENKLLHTVKTFRKLRDTRHGLLELLRKETGEIIIFFVFDGIYVVLETPS